MNSVYILLSQIKGSVIAPVDRSVWGDKRHWIMFSGVDNLSVEGGGVIDGNGNVWWQNSCKIKKSSVRFFSSSFSSYFFYIILIDTMFKVL